MRLFAFLQGAAFLLRVARLASGGCGSCLRLLLLNNDADLFHDFFFIEPCKKRPGILRHFCSRGIQTEGIQCVKITQLCIQLQRDLLCRLRHERSKQRGAHDDAFGQIVHHSRKPVRLRGILCQNPRLRLVNIFIEALEYRKDIL